MSTLSAGGGVSTASVVLRWLFLAGVLLAGGAALTGRMLLEPGRRRLETAVAGVGLLLVAGGGFGLLALEPAADATRFGRVTETAAIVALVGFAAALASIAVPPLAYAVTALAVLELAAPTLAGHALDPRHLRWLVALADFAHVAAAAFWTGGLALLVLDRGPRARRRFPPLAARGGRDPRRGVDPARDRRVPDARVGRAHELRQGRARQDRAARLVPRRRLAEPRPDRPSSASSPSSSCSRGSSSRSPCSPTCGRRRARRPRPGRRSQLEGRWRRRPPTRSSWPGRTTTSPSGFAVSPRGRDVAARVTALARTKVASNGLASGSPASTPRPAGPAATARRSRCHRRRGASPSRSRQGRSRRGCGSRSPRAGPRRPTPALVARAGRVFRALRTLVIHERLASNSRNAIDTIYLVEAPNRMAYTIRGGPRAVVIGRSALGQASRPEVGALLPGAAPPARAVLGLGPGPERAAARHRPGRGRPVRIVSFYDPKLPAWFVLDRRPAHRPAARPAHDGAGALHAPPYSGFDRPLRIVPPVQP